jgi:hypothetical protein
MKIVWIALGIGLLAGCSGSTQSTPTPNGTGGASGNGGASGTSGTDAGGTSGSGGAPADAGKSCGTIAGLTCAPNEWCDYTENAPNELTCGGADDGGTCRPRPPGCPADCPGVCGCDGKFYCNACVAHQAGIDDTSSMACMHGGGDAGAGCTSDSDCQSGLKCCYPCGVPGCSNECIKPEPSGQCPLFP